MTARSEAGTAPALRGLLACHECDALYQELRIPAGAQACCRRCGAVLSHQVEHGVVRPLAYTCAAAILFIIANVSPIMGLEFEGVRNASTLVGAVQALFAQDMAILGTLVVMTTLVIPALDLSAMLYLLFAAYADRRPPGFALVFRWVLALKPWGMVEVFLLGVLVALVKLAHMATVMPGIALWAYVGVMLLLALTASTLVPRELWAHGDPVREAID
jgi:paraquat-inducible protein A